MGGKAYEGLGSTEHRAPRPLAASRGLSVSVPLLAPCPVLPEGEGESHGAGVTPAPGARCPLGPSAVSGARAFAGFPPSL